MNARERFKQALVKIGYSELIDSGWTPLLFDEALERARAESGASEADARRALQEMVSDYLLIDEGDHYRATAFLALKYEEGDRSAAYGENDVRRRVLTTVIKMKMSTQRSG